MTDKKSDVKPEKAVETTENPGYIGTAVDPEPNESYTLTGQAAK